MGFRNIVFCLLLIVFFIVGTNTSALTTHSSPMKRASTNHKLNDHQIVRTMNKANDVIAKADAEVTGKNLWYTKILPVYPAELPKFLSLSFMMFWIIYIFTISRDTKDTLIVTNCGAEAIAFLKVYGVVPAAAAFMFLYSHLATTFTPRALFYITVAPFIAFYTAFAFVLYPMRHVLHPMSIAVPAGGMSFAVNLLRHWTFSLYYIVSEVWGSAGIPLLFWSCANDVIKIEQAKRIYPLISLIGNLGPIFAGLSMTLVSKAVSRRFAQEDAAFEASLKVLAAFTALAGAFVSALYWNTHRLNDLEMKAAVVNLSKSIPVTSASSASNSTQSNVPHRTSSTPAPVSPSGTSSQPHTTSPPVIKSKKVKPSFVESMRLLAANDYLRNVAVMVLSYGLTMEFTEIIWKSSVKSAFPVKTEYLAFMGRYSTLVGSSAFVMMFVGSNLVKALGWRAGALMTPLMMGLLAAPFFGCIIFGGLSSPSALKIAVYVGLVQNVLSKATKYAIFDPTKEMTYIPLDAQSKTQGKAAIDVLGARIGKSGGALVQQVLVLLFGSILQGAPLVALLFYGVIFAWIGAVNKLSPMFAQRSAEKEGQDSAEKAKRL